MRAPDMKRFTRCFAAACLATAIMAWSTSAPAMAWQPAPVDSHAGHAGHDMRRMPQQFVLQGSDGAAIRLLLPDLSERPLTMNAAGGVSVAPTGMEYFHTLVAERHTGSRVETAIRYLHLFGKPSGHSPSELLDADKAKLDIVPDPLPREHWSYMAGHDSGFVVRFDGHPLAGQTVLLQTSYGTQQSLVTDATGRLVIELPDDFTAVKPGRRNNSPAEFVLSTRYRDSPFDYTTTLSAPYNADPSHWQSLPIGAATVVGGLLLGGLLSYLLQRQTDPGQRKKRSS